MVEWLRWARAGNASAAEQLIEPERELAGLSPSTCPSRRCVRARSIRALETLRLVNACGERSSSLV
jgi:hypothetical protein